MVCFLLGKARRRALMTAFTFDLLVICDALAECAQRGIVTTLVVDGRESATGRTAAQAERLECLRARGVEVYHQSGLERNGLQHSKLLLVDNVLVTGSANWTGNSRNCHELDVLIELSESGVAKVEEKLGYIRKGARLLTAEASRHILDSKAEAKAKLEAQARATSPTAPRSSSQAPG